MAERVQKETSKNYSLCAPLLKSDKNYQIHLTCVLETLPKTPPKIHLTS